MTFVFISKVGSFRGDRKDKKSLNLSTQAYGGILFFGIIFYFKKFAKRFIKKPGFFFGNVIYATTRGEKMI
ncbi:hypothetical protein [Dysgonomonas alginatilytica]|uniref:hypothetical protein n=1 Tax=Dysgonomonas alginatilytica TaxID=1605892 RepID=UPI000D7610D8|nr:hypothetical protein [Dysgonomonas alginatilytica]